MGLGVSGLDIMINNFAASQSLKYTQSSVPSEDYGRLFLLSAMLEMNEIRKEAKEREQYREGDEERAPILSYAE